MHLMYPDYWQITIICYTTTNLLTAYARMHVHEYENLNHIPSCCIVLVVNNMVMVVNIVRAQSIDLQATSMPVPQSQR